MEIQTETGLQKALQHIEKGNPSDAIEIIGKLFENDLSCKELAYASRCCTYLSGITEKAARLETPYERGEKIIDEWKNYLTFSQPDSEKYEPALYAMQRGVFGLALSNYSELFEDSDMSLRANAFWKAGICYKKLGEFEKAQECMREANALQENNASFLANLADCFCLCGEDNYGKLIFREAFFLDPMKIDLDFLDSQLIRSLIEKTAGKGFSGSLLQLWLPVYAVIWGVFDVKRSLRSQEVTKLRQDIYALENEMKEPGSDEANIKPRLINLYFWLIDYYGQTADNSRKINEVLLRIKILDQNIFKLYSK